MNSYGFPACACRSTFIILSKVSGLILSPTSLTRCRKWGTSRANPPFPFTPSRGRRRRIRRLFEGDDQNACELMGSLNQDEDRNPYELISFLEMRINILYDVPEFMSCFRQMNTKISEDEGHNPYGFICVWRWGLQSLRIHEVLDDVNQNSYEFIRLLARALEASIWD